MYDIWRGWKRVKFPSEVIKNIFRNLERSPGIGRVFCDVIHFRDEFYRDCFEAKIDEVFFVCSGRLSM